MKMAPNTAALLKNVPLPDEIPVLHENAVVIDCGGHHMRGGFSGDDFPRVQFPTLHRGVRPIQRAEIRDWDAMEKLWEKMYIDLHTDPSDPNVPVLITEAPLTEKSHRDHIAQIFFEKLKVPSIYFAQTPVMSLYATGRTTGLVIECGHETCNTVPIFHGFSLYHSILQLPFGGHHQTEWIEKQLAGRGMAFEKSHKLSISEFIKEKLAAVALDYPTALKAKSDPQSIKLPDESEVSLGPERWTCCEGLFDPSLIGVESPRGLHTSVTESVKKCDEDMTDDLYENIVLSGSGSMFRGMEERMHKELQGLAPSARNLQICAIPDRKRSAWVGASIFASLPTFQNAWVTKQDYEERPDVIHRNCF